MGLVKEEDRMMFMQGCGMTLKCNWSNLI